MHFDWDPEKNEEIQTTHGISFEEIVTLISRGGLVKSVKNPSDKYPDQKIMLVRKGKAIYLVPYESRANTHWLITAFYSEKFTKKYARQK
jgi:uncharacterized DUF497 family protein